MKLKTASLLLAVLLAAVLPFSSVAMGEASVAAPATQPVGSLAANPATGPITRGQQVFSTGHSFHFGFPTILTEIAQSGGYSDALIVGVSSIGGSTVSRHWSDTKDTPAMAALKSSTVDVLTATPIYIKPPDTGVENFARLGLEHNPHFRLAMMEFWLPYDNYEPRNYWKGPKGSPTERVNPPTVNHNAVTVEALRAMHEAYFKEMDDMVVDINKKLGKQVVYVVPVGQAVLALREKVIAGQVPGVAAQTDLFADQLGHPKMPMKILIGYCHYAVIYRKSPIGLPVPKELGQGKDAEAMNALLQQLAWDAVTRHPLSGVAAK